MWWEPQSDAERSLTALLDQLDSASRDGVLPHVAGIGSSVDELGRRVPFLLVDASLDPRPHEWSGGRERSLVHRLARRSFIPGPGSSERTELLARIARDLDLRPSRRTLDDDSLVKLTQQAHQNENELLRLVLLLQLRRRADRLRTQLHPVATGVAVYLAYADTDTQASIRKAADVPDTTLVCYIGRGRTTAAWRVHGAPRPWATLGLSVLVPPLRFFTTAGHLGAPTGTTLYRTQRQWFHTRDEVLGTVRHTTAPGSPDATPPAGVSVDGIDLALVEGSRPWPLVTHSIEPVDGRNVCEFELASFEGAASRRRRSGQVLGPMRWVHKDGLQHRRCWTVVVASRAGDSGAAMTYMPGRKLLGHVVGAIGIPEQDGSREVTCVQDGRTLIDCAEQYLGNISDVAAVD